MLDKSEIRAEIAKLNDDFEDRVADLIAALEVSEDDSEDKAEPGPASPAPNPFNVFRYWYRGARSQSYSSWFHCWGGLVGAAHSDEGFEDPADRPPFAVGREVLRPGGLDAVLYGCVKPTRAPRQLRVGDRVRIYGYPGGSEFVAIREGHVYLRRPEGGSWIIAFDDGEELAVGGMSGGAMTVIENGRETLAAILVTQNSPADVDGDGETENGADVVSLRDVWEAWR